MKKNYILFVICFIVTFVQSCKKDVDKSKDYERLSETNIVSNKKVNVKLLAVNDSEVFGSAIFKEEGNKVTMIALINNLKATNYKMLIINDDNCSNLVENESLHWNPTNEKHGLWGDESGYHKGDIGYLKTDDLLKNGTLSFSTNEWCIDCDDDTKNILGKGLIIIEERSDSISDKKDNVILSCGQIKKEN
ncbi:superoxide dismutase [Algibacter marinivivus]|uniref:Superoxide dismutase n=1 Tax=Algibacter marinivivus TaxID=2100723 RepID=A0A2U2X0U1_9FLAO|nr:superoxide dismutase family protein [Algibacter marinivivus]PWH81401.1 superoxide dismutase [Algibacter marinivivus]